MKPFAPAVALCVSAVLPFSVFPQTSHPRSVTGNVVYADTNQPVENVMVELRSGGGTIINREATSGSGTFAFRDLTPTTYHVTIELQGYRPVDMAVDLSFSSSHGNTLALQPESDLHVPSRPGALVSAHELAMPQKARDAFEKGKIALYEKKNAKAAAAQFQEAIKGAGGFYEAYYQLGMAELMLDRPNNAEKDVRTSLALSNDTYAPADVALGTLLLDRSAVSEAEKTLRRAVALDPNSWLGEYELGRALLSLDRIDEAKACAIRAQKMDPKAPVVYRLLSNIHIRERDDTALLADLNAYIELDPSSPAGIRAKQMREQLERKLAAGSRTSKQGPKAKP